MTDSEKLLIALLSEDDANYDFDGTVTLGDVVGMLDELGREYRRVRRSELASTSA